MQTFNIKIGCCHLDEKRLKKKKKKKKKNPQSTSVVIVPLNCINHSSKLNVNEHTLIPKTASHSTV